MEQTKYSAARSLEVHGFFVSRFRAFVALFLFVSLVIALVVLAALLAHEKGKEKYAQVKSNPAQSGKSNIEQAVVDKSVSSALKLRHIQRVYL